ncbi:MAG: DNA translocase FtsK [Candidatus Scalindua sp.]|nr:DNA translocase FtsK [Candidatus Scalindua sp.]
MERAKVFHSAYSMSIFTIAVFLLISIATFSPNDPPFGNYPLNNPVQNYCGKLGAGISGYLISSIGVISYLLALLIGALGIILFLRKKVEILWVKIFGAILFILSITPILSIFSFSVKTFKLPPDIGGIFGIVTSLKLMEYLGVTGASILLTLGLLVAVMLISDKSLEPLVLWGYKKCKGLNFYHPMAREYVGKIIEKVPSRRTLNLVDDICELDEPVRKRDEITTDEPVRRGDEITTQVRIKSADDERKPKRPDKIMRKDTAGFSKDQDYVYPPLELLDELQNYKFDNDEHVMEKSEVLKRTLAQFNVNAEIVGIERGPSVTMHELDLAPGTKLGKVSSLSDDIAIALKAPSIRIVAPIQGKSTIGIEVPNTHRKPVKMRELFGTVDKHIQSQSIPLLLGKDIAGYPLIADLADMPHLLVAGTTGSGKSVCLNSIILSILFLQHPKNLKLLLIDPKMVEFSPFKNVPHLITPVVTDMKRAAAILEWAVNKMDERYALLARAGVRNIVGYNKLDELTKQKRLNPEGDATIDEETFFMPHLVIIVDELADLMMVASKEVETSIIRISQKSRAVGIHLIVATQRPSVDVITGLIKSNLPSRIAFYVFSKVDSRTILDQNGAEKLLGRGDMLFLPPGTSKLERVQGTFVSEEEVNRIVEFLKERAHPEFSPELKNVQGTLKKSDSVKDDLYDEAIRIILESQRGSVSLLQRRLEIGYSRAARLIDLMAEDGFVGEYKGSQAREVYITLDDWTAQRNQN